MNRINKFSLEPGTYTGPRGIVVLLEIITHSHDDVELKEPIVVYRDLISDINNTKVYFDTIENFKSTHHHK